MPFAIDLKKRPRHLRDERSSIALFVDGSQNIPSRAFNFDLPNVDRRIVAQIASAFFEVHLGSRPASRQRSFAHTMHFMRYIAESGFGDQGGEPMLAFMEYLIQQNTNGAKLSLAQCHTIYGSVAKVLRAAKHLSDPEWLRCTDVPLQPFKKPRSFGSAKKLLSVSDFNAIESAALEAIQQLSEKTNAYLPRAEDLVPFALLLIMRAWINVEPLRLLGRDCLQPSEFPNLDKLVWIKYRSQKECSISDTRASYRVPDLVRRLMRLTEPLMSFVGEADRSKLLICETWRYGRVKQRGLIAQSSLQYYSSEFLKSIGISGYTLGDLRASAMDTDFRERRNLDATSTRAQHESKNETVGYLNTPEGVRRNDQLIASAQKRFQGHFLEALDDTSINVMKPGENASASDLSFADNIHTFGLICSNPLEGIGPGSKRGEVCPSLFGCFTCRNARFPNDPDLIARLIQLRSALIERRPFMQSNRWELIFAPVLEILDRDLLPRISASILDDAQRIALQLPSLMDFTYLA